VVTLRCVLCLIELGSDQVAYTYTAEEAIEELGFGCFQWKIILFSCIFLVWFLLSHLSVAIRCKIT